LQTSAGAGSIVNPADVTAEVIHPYTHIFVKAYA
jgi:hypothetical protein